ncbi:MAG: type II toxin-antitoxin system HicA family toxin [Pyrinomonadaceae bacterium]|nr:type II toxin-antitoxin system HicA family toxin [Blastocatellia bacterium]
MNRKQQKTLDSIFETPTRANIEFSGIEKLLNILGAETIEGRGSRVSFELNGEKLFLHRPHPAKEAKKYQIEAFREFLERVGIRNG